MKKYSAVFILLFVPCAGLHAQEIASGRIISLGGMSTAFATDVDAIGTNPANLIEPSPGRVVLEILPISVNAGSDFLSLGLYNDYFTGTGQVDSSGNKIGKYLTASDKANILNAFPDGVGTVRFGTVVRTVALSVRENSFALGFSIDDNVGGLLSLPSSLLFPLDGNSPGSTISINGLSSMTWWYRTYNLDYAMKLPTVSLFVPEAIADNFKVGGGIKLATGFSYSDIRSTNSSLYTDPTNYSYTINMGLDGVRAGLISSAISKGVDSKVGAQDTRFDPLNPQGLGMGFDLGASARVLRIFNVGMSLTDIGWISWTKTVVGTYGDTSFTYSGFSPAQVNAPGSTSNLDSLKNSFSDYFANRDAASSGFTTALPTRLNIGASVQLGDLISGIPGGLLVGFDYHQGLNESLGNITTPEFVVGAEWKPVAVFPIRTAVGFGGVYGFSWSIGIGLDLPFWDIDLGIGTLNSVVVPNSAKNISFGMNIFKFRF